MTHKVMGFKLIHKHSYFINASFDKDNTSKGSSLQTLESGNTGAGRNSQLHRVFCGGGGRDLGQLLNFLLSQCAHL